MHKFCTNCGTANSEQANFCTRCGDKFDSHEATNTGAKERTPTEHAAEITESARVEANKVLVRTTQIWAGFSGNEKIIAGGSLVGLVSFFLPWVSGPFTDASGLDLVSETSIGILMLVSMVASLVVLYTTRGASEIRKTRKTWWHIVIGFLDGAIGILFIVAINNEVNKCIWLCGRVGSGLYVFTAGAIAVLVGAFRLRRELLHHKLN